MKRLPRAIIASVLLILSTSCNGDKELCGGYKLVWTSGVEACIYRPSGGDTMVNGNVASYGIHPPYIGGFVTFGAPDPKIDTKANSGYFLLDTTTDKRLERLSESQFMKEAQKIGWPNPKLIRIRR
jgi:hypothetical protein